MVKVNYTYTYNYRMVSVQESELDPSRTIFLHYHVSIIMARIIIGYYIQW